MLIPKRVKYRRQHRPNRSGVSKGGNTITFGDYGLFEARTTFGRIGVKVWIYKGDVVGGRREGVPATPSADRAPRRERPQRRRSGASGTTSGGTEAGRAAAEQSAGGVATVEAPENTGGEG